LRLFRTTIGIFVEDSGTFYPADSGDWDELVSSPDLHARTKSIVRQGLDRNSGLRSIDPGAILAPILSQEVWAAGVTYYRSRSARMEESKDAGGGSFYDRVYSAERPELFFKATGRRVIGPNGRVLIRSDAKWSVPEPEVALLINPAGQIVGYTIGNDMSSRDIEGENPLYLPQAKVYDGSCALGPCIAVGPEPPKTTAIGIEIVRAGKTVFAGSTTLAELKREPKELVQYLYRDNSFPQGALLMTGTGIVPGDNFSLAHGDTIRIRVDGVGVLENSVG